MALQRPQNRGGGASGPCDVRKVPCAGPRAVLWGWITAWTRVWRAGSGDHVLTQAPGLGCTPSPQLCSTAPLTSPTWSPVWEDGPRREHLSDNDRQGPENSPPNPTPGGCLPPALYPARGQQGNQASATRVHLTGPLPGVI